MDSSFHALWIGQLGPMEQLTLTSFLSHGHEVSLWIYEGLTDLAKVPDNVILMDADPIMPREQIFAYQDGPHKGSYGGFSDKFRYKILYLYGGWWIDMDVTCLRRFDFESEYIFRPSKHDPPVVGNIMRVPSHSELMAYCMEETAKIDASNTKWFMPIIPLYEGIKKFNLEQHIQKPELFGVDDCEKISRYLREDLPVEEHYAIHWCNEHLRLNNISKLPTEQTTYQSLLCRYGVS
jgi:hypothetical protein